MKMTIDQIVALSNAGFTKQEILQVAGLNDNPTQTQTAVPTVPVSAPTAVQTVQIPKQVTTSETDINERFNKLEAMIQRNAILGTAQPPTKSLQEQADDVLLSLIISPDGREK